MSHATCTQGNQVDSRLLVVGSQIANLTVGLSFGHNLCFRCLNGWCEPILDIYFSIAFQWHKELFEPLGFDPCNHSLNIRESTGSPPGLQLPKWKLLWECEGSFPHTFLHSRVSLLARNIASPCLGREPKAKVATSNVYISKWLRIWKRSLQVQYIFPFFVMRSLRLITNHGFQFIPMWFKISVACLFLFL
jgi:hypothetical protein